MLKAVQVNNITRLLADFGVGQLNVTYMTNFERTSNFTFEMEESPWNKI